MLAHLLRLGVQYGRFGTVGATSTALHVTIFAALVELAGLAPLAANFVSFCAAVCVSFLGHFYWTFREQTLSAEGQRQGVALVRFAAVALTGLAVSSVAVYLVVNLLELPYLYAIGLVIIVVPLFMFALSKFWVFAPMVAKVS